MRRHPLVYTLGALLLTSLGLASAQDAYTSRPMNVRAGPNREYPLVAQLDAGAPLDVHGCLDDWSWCDVSFEDSRGWIYAGGVSFVYQGGRVPLYSYGPKLGLPIIAFSLTGYWGDYYRGRPWYAQRDTWSHRTLPPHQRPSGRPHAGPPPVSAGRPPMSHGRAPEGGRPQPQGGERGRPAPSGARPHTEPSGGRPHAEPSPTPRGHPPGGSGEQPRNAPEPRASQHGHAASPSRGTQPRDRKPGSQPPDHPPQ
jgi:uncharacterized protein YraI